MTYKADKPVVWRYDSSRDPADPMIANPSAQVHEMQVLRLTIPREDHPVNRAGQ
jgi:hypothetical protein